MNTQKEIFTKVIGLSITTLSTEIMTEVHCQDQIEAAEYISSYKTKDLTWIVIPIRLT